MPLSNLPTARHENPVAHETELTMLLNEPLLGLSSFVQLVPSHFNTND